MRITASEVALATGGTLIGTDISAEGISFDTRDLLSRQAFVAIRGERDGHDFLASAFARGAAFAIVEVGRFHPGSTCVEVGDTVKALGDLGRHCRQRLDGTLDGRIIGITGSVGKTSTKDLLHAVLSSHFPRTHSPRRSLNNDIGVPATIINAPDDCDALIMEMGMRGFGEIARLCDIGQPAIGINTANGDAHGERVGGITGVIRAKAELLEALPSHGTAVVNRDSEAVMAAARSSKARCTTFGAARTADLRYEIISTDELGISTVTFTSGADSAIGVVPLPGVHMVSNAAAAVATGITVGIPLGRCVEALGKVVPASQRMQWRKGKSGARILDDSYNANPLSMQAALETIGAMSARRKVAVLGVMAEVDEVMGAHRAIASACATMNIELLPLETDLYGTAALTVDEVLGRLGELDESAVVVVKGSRIAAAERVVQRLID